MGKNVLEVILSGSSKELDAALAKADKSLTAYGQKIKDIGSSMTTRLSLPMALAGGAAIKMASDFNESLNKVEVAFKDSSSEVKDFAKTTLKSFGIAEGSALDMAALFGDMSTSMGLTTQQAAKMSTSLVGLAGDMASFKNMNIEEVTTALNGIFTGETESLKRLGIVMTETNVKQYAMTQGITKQYEAMTQAEKTMLRYNYVMSVTANSQGDFERTGGGAANQMRLFQESMKELGNTFGQIVLPAFTKLVKYANEVLSSLKDLSPEAKTVIVALAGFAAVAGPIMYIAGSVMPKFTAAMVLANKVSTTLGLTLSTGLGLGALVVGLGFAINKIYDYNKALGGNNGLNDVQKQSTENILSNNKEIEKSIALLEQRKMASKNAVITGFGSETGSSVNYQKQIDEQKRLLAINKKVLAERAKTPKVAPNTNTGVDFKMVGGGAGVEDLTKSLDFQEKMKEIQRKGEEERYKMRQEAGAADIAEQDLLYKKLLLNTGEKGKETLELLRQWFSYDISTSDFFKSFQKLNGVVSGIKTPMSVMDEAIRKSEEAKKTELEKTNLAFEQGVLIQQAIGNSMAQVFTNMGETIVQSMGLAKTGIDGFVGGMMKTLIDLGAIVVKQLAMNLAASLGWGISGAAQSGAATGPAAIFSTPAFIATAIGGITAAFASIPAFAEGGIVSGPTMGLIGEYPGAKSNPEVIAPLNKLQGMIDSSRGDTAMVGEFRLQGQDLVLALQRANNQKGRIS